MGFAYVVFNAVPEHYMTLLTKIEADVREHLFHMALATEQVFTARQRVHYLVSDLSYFLCFST